MSDTLGAAVIGLGMMGERHARIWSELPQTRLVSVCDIIPERAEAVAGDYPCRVAASLEEAVSAPGVDIVSVCTDDQSHLQPCLAAAKAGKHVLVEKPLATSLEHCDRIIEACERAGVKLMTGHVCRFDPRYVACREAVQTGEVGEIVQVFARRNNIVASGRRIGPRTSVAYFLGVHEIDLISWIADARITRVCSEASSKVLADLGREDTILSLVRLDNGAVGVIETCWVIPEGSPNTLDARLEVVGTAGRVAAQVGADEVMEAADARRSRRPDMVYWTEVHGRAQGALPDQLEHFAQCILDDAETVISPQDARHAVEVADAMHRSLATGAPVDL